MKNVMFCVMTVAAGAAFGVAYDPAVHGDPIVVTTDEAVTIEGDGATVDGGGKVRCATLGPNVTLKNFTLTNGFADWGGGVRGGRLEGCRLVDCSAALAGGACGATLVGCTVSGCTATESGAALGDCTATGCTITANRLTAGSTTAAVHGGLVYGSTLANCSLTDNSVMLSSAAPSFGGIGERVTLTGCTVARNTVAGDLTAAYGPRFAQSTIDGKYVEFDDSLTPVDPDEPTDFDGSVAHVYSLALEDGSVLAVSTAKASGDGSVAVTAKLTKGGKTYSYVGGRLERGVVVALPTCRVYGSPSLAALVLKRDTATAVVDGQAAAGSCLTQSLFDKALKWTPDACNRVGVAYEAQVGADGRVGPVKFSASGLPGGLKLDKATGRITGVPTKAKGEYLAKITLTSALDSKLKSVTEIPIEIVPLHDWVEGTYAGGGEGGQLQQLKIAKNGKLSGKWSAGGVVWTLSAKSFDAYDAAGGAYVATLDCKSGKTVRTCAVTLTAEGLVGLCDVGGAFEAVRNDWKMEPWKTLGKRLAKADALVFRPTAYGSDANDRVSLKVSAGGAVKAKGQFVRDYDAKGRPKYYSASVSSVLCPLKEPDGRGSFVGVAYLYFMPKAKTPIASDGAKAERVVLGWDGVNETFYGPIDAEPAEE